MYLKLRRLAKGCYSWKNGIWVCKEGSVWRVFWGCGEVAFEGGTLMSCKYFLYRRYPESFRF